MESISKTIIGWKEAVEFPDWNLTNVITAANTEQKRSIIYGRNLQILEDQTAKFDFTPDPLEKDAFIPVTAIVSNWITDDSIKEIPLFETGIQLGKRKFNLKFLFEELGEQKFVCEFGRKTLAGSFIVDADKKFKISKNPKKKKPPIVPTNAETDTVEAS